MAKNFKTIDLVYIGLFAALISICAWISIPMTISITLQTMAICLTAGLLGAKRGTLTVVVYIMLGAVGLPVFTGFKGGIGAIMGATGGYIVGFIFTALIVGIASERVIKGFWGYVLFMAIGVIVCYAFGTVWFAIMYKVSFGSALSTCVIPFLLPDAVKIVLAAFLTQRLKKFVH